MQSLSFGPQSYAGKHPNHPSHMVTKRLFVSGILAASILGGIIGALLGHLALGKGRNVNGQNGGGGQANVHPVIDNSDEIHTKVNSSYIQDTFRYGNCCL